MTVRALGAAIILLTSGAAALAADLPVTAVPVTPVWPRTWDWNGFYGGINAGGSFGEAKNFWNVPALSVTGSDRETQIGPLGGIQLGWNWQYSALLWGLEGDIDVAGQRGKATFNSPFSVTTGSGATATITSGTVTIPLRDDLILIGTLRGRLGATFGPALVYVTGGFAWAAARQDIAGTLIKSTGSTALFINDTRLTSLPVGWTVGAGGEWACGLHWTLRAEYLFTDLERTDRTFVTEPAFSGKIAAGIGTIGTRRIDNVARVGINYKFAPF